MKMKRNVPSLLTNFNIRSQQSSTMITLNIASSWMREQPATANGTAQTIRDVRAAVKPFLSRDAKEDFLRACWSIDIHASKGAFAKFENYNTYFHHYEHSCRYISADLTEITHEHICNIVHLLSHGTRKEVQNNISSSSWLSTTLTAPVVVDLVAFVTKSTMMINCDSWSMTETFEEFLKRKLVRSKQPDKYRLRRSFNLRKFEITAGITMCGTSDLLSHLELGENDQNISIFHNMQLLDMLRQSDFCKVFPDGALDELNRSLWLLLPLNDRRCEKWIRRRQRELDFGLKFDEYKHLAPFERNLEDFNFWKDRLIIAKDAFDESQPSGILQFWHDDRNKAQWYAFWVAIVVFILTLIGVVEGAMQVYKAYHPS